MEITKEIQFDYGHVVHHHNSFCKNPHGHRAKVVAHLDGELIQEVTSENGMVMDFKHIKKIMMEKIHDVLDHSFIISIYAPQLDYFLEMNRACYEGEMRLVVLETVPTAENLAKWCWDAIYPEILDVYKTNLRLKSIEFWETPTSAAIYSHQPLILEKRNLRRIKKVL